MESPGSINELLDFSSDVAEEEGNGKEEKPHLTGLGPVPLGLFDFDTYDTNYPLLDPPEEELEWISNKDAFPQIEAFGEILPNFSLPEYPSAAEKQCSPVKVFETTSGGSNCSGSSPIGAMSCCLGGGGVTFPSKARSKRRRSERRDLRWLCAENPENSPRRKAVKAVNGTIVGRKCQHCGSEKTPQWRAGPAGPKTLCNACGVRYKSGRLIPEYRPASSPTYSAEMHSNSHRKILEMRRHRQFGGSTSTAGEPERCE